MEKIYETNSHEIAQYGKASIFQQFSTSIKKLEFRGETGH